MKIQCTETLWKKIRKYNICEKENLETYDGAALMSALYVDEVNDVRDFRLSDTDKVIKFVSTSNCLDPIDMPVSTYVVVNSNSYFNTDTFKLETVSGENSIEEQLEIKTKELEIKTQECSKLKQQLKIAIDGLLVIDAHCKQVDVSSVLDLIEREGRNNG